MEKKKKIRFYWEEPEEKGQDAARGNVLQKPAARLPPFRISFRFPKIAAQESGVRMKKSGDDVTVTVPVHGYQKSDLSVNVSPMSLRIRAEKKAEHRQQAEGSFMSFSSSSRMEKSFSLPEEVVPGSSKVSFDKGELSVTMKLAKKARQ